MYEIVTAKMPGVNTPCRKRQNSNEGSPQANAAARVEAARPKPAITMVFLRPMRSEILPAMGAVSAMPSVLAVTVRLARNAVIPSALLNTGRIGWVA